MIKINSLSICLLLFIISGCAKVQHLPELLTLKGVADAQVAMAKEVTAADKKFDALAADVKTGKIADYKNRKAIVRKFGPPILSEERMKDGALYNVALYRYATQFFGSDKVYLYYDGSGALKKWEFISPEEKAQAPQ